MAKIIPWPIIARNIPEPEKQPLRKVWHLPDLKGQFPPGYPEIRYDGGIAVIAVGQLWVHGESQELWDVRAVYLRKGSQGAQVIAGKYGWHEKFHEFDFTEIDFRVCHGLYNEVMLGHYFEITEGP